MRRLRSLRGQAGFTFLESLLSLAIGGLIISGIISVLFQINVLTRTQQDTLTVQTQIQNALSMLNHDLVSASQGTVTLGDEGAQLVITQPEYTFGEEGDPVSTVVTYTFASGILTRASGGQELVVARALQSVDLGAAGALPQTVQITLLAQVRDRSYSRTLVVDRRAQ
jgi:prepilin-type N-terminal cleavage/methylation domain-containing protein